MPISTIVGLAVAVATSTAPPAQPAASARRCPNIEGYGRLETSVIAAKARYIVVGERHGTMKTPLFFQDLVCAFSKGRSLNVFLEIKYGSTKSVQTFMDSDGGSDARQALLSDDAWDPKLADGRNSEAIFKLLAFLRDLKASGSDIRVYCTQPDYLEEQIQFYDELGRAELWARLAASRPAALNMILVGRAHAALRDNNHLGFLPAAAHLKVADVIAIKSADEGGSAWGLDVSPTGQPILGPQSVPGYPHQPSGIKMLPDRSTGWQAVYYAGSEAVPSPPARKESLPRTSDELPDHGA